MTIVLLGLPGVGKSTVGAAVASVLGWSFLDFDVEIERRAGLTVAGIFERHGEAHFRRMEAALTEELAGRGRMVLAPGGGWAAQEGLADRLRPTAKLVYLRASPAVVARRLGEGSGTRPLLAGGDLTGKLERLFIARAPIYDRADHVIDTELLDEKQVIRMVAALAPVGVGCVG